MLRRSLLPDCPKNGGTAKLAEKYPRRKSCAIQETTHFDFFGEYDMLADAVFRFQSVSIVKQPPTGLCFQGLCSFNAWTTLAWHVTPNHGGHASPWQRNTQHHDRFDDSSVRLTRIIFTGTIAKKWLTSWLVGGFKEFFMKSPPEQMICFWLEFFRCFFCHQQKSSVQTSLWGGGFLGDGSWSRSSHEWYSSTRWGPRLKGFLGIKPWQWLRKTCRLI